jgi:hypothetical protein
MTFRKSIVTALLFLVVISGAYSAYWFYARTIVAESIDRWTGLRRAEGYEIAFDPPEFAGYPMRIRVILGQPRIQRGEFSWRAEQLRLESRPWNFREIRADLEGKQWLSLSGKSQPITLDAGEAVVVARFSSSGRPVDADLLFRDLELSDPKGKIQARIAEVWLEATAPEIPQPAHTDKSLTISLSTTEISLTEDVAPSLGQQISKLRADLNVKGALPRRVSNAALETWRRSGGTVDVDWFHVVWGKVDLRAKGTVALDAQSRPLGAFSSDIRGHNHILDALVERKVIERKTVTFAKIGLSLLAKSPPEGGVPVLTLPVTAQDGHLYAGPVKILDLAPIRLPAPVPPR